MTKPLSHRSIDGFMPNTPDRHVGFPSGPPKLDNLHRVPARRPGLHSAASPSLPPVRSVSTPGPSTPAGRRNFPEFTTYRSPGQRNFIGDRPAAQHAAIGDQLCRQPRRDDTTTKKQSFLKRLRHANWKKISKRGALALGVFILLCGGWLGWKIYHDTSKAFGGNVIGFLNATKLKGEDQGRVNILLAGDSADDPGHNGADLTDSIMLLSIDTRNNKAIMMSIPRDLYVNLPDDMGHQKINAANTDTTFSQTGYPKGGMGALESVVSQDLGIPIDYYALVNYTAFRDAVNAVGGISINIKSSDPRGLYDPNTSTRLPNGQDTLDGVKALDLARSRGDGYGSYGFPDSDFDRTQYQREIGLAIKSKVFSTGVLANPLKLGQLFDSIGNNVKTDLTTGNVHRLYDIFNHISNNSIQSIGLNSYNNTDYLANYQTDEGQSALIPAAGLDNFSQIQQLMQKLTSNSQVVKESASVVVLNGGDLTGLAAKEGSVLAGKGMDVVTTTDAPANQTSDTIIDQSSGAKPATLSELKKLFGSSVTSSPPAGVSYPSADFIVILGTNQQMPN